MNSIKRKVISVVINEIDYDFVLDFGAAMEYYDLAEKSIYEGIQDALKLDYKALGNVIASCLKKKGEVESVGINFVKSLDFQEYGPYFINKIPELFENSVDKDEVETNKKK